MTNKPLVSCIIPSYKRSETLVRAINSALNQTYNNIEVLVVDDNIKGDDYSTVLHNIIDQYGSDSRVRLISQEKHINGAEARNAGVRASQADYIAFLDDDDVWLPSKIMKQMEIMQADPDLAGVAGGATLWEGDKEVSRLPDFAISEENMLLDVLIRKVDFTTSTFLCKKSAFEAIGGFDVNLIRSQDLQLFTDFLAHYRIFPLVNERTTKIFAESNINRLDSRKLANNKEKFFNSVSDVIGKFPKSTQNRIRSAHYYEIALVAIKEKKVFFALKYLLKGLKSPTSVLDLYKRFISR